MPTLEWMGKDRVVTHHRQVPYRVLEQAPDKGVLDSHGSDQGNMVIHGDNLEALKSLLPTYAGRVDCIYIDPPYNTGNEGWVYNDSVNDPRIRAWLGKTVGREGEDFTRHDKWLCMMYPRLVLLRQLLAESGVIFVSIDDNELANLRLVLDEIFGASCFVADVSWQRNYSTRNDSKGIPAEVEHILVYGRRPDWQPRKLPRTTKMDAKYKNPDNDLKPWTSADAFAPGAVTHQGMVYAIQHPFTGEMIYPYNGACWRYQQDAMLDYMNGWCEYRLEDLHDEKTRAEVCGVAIEDVRPGVKAIVLAHPLGESREHALKVLKRGQWPRFYFTRNGKGGIRRKTYLDSVGGRLATNYWPYSETGHTDEAKKEIKAIFDGALPFDTPKPVRLLKRVLAIGADRDSLVLDSFAGSGTTAHAVMDLNREDGGHRRFILVEMMDYADDVTAERARRVIHGYGEGRGHVEGLDSGFSYFELGPELFNPDGNLNPDVPRSALYEYIWHSESRSPWRDLTGEHRYLAGREDGMVCYVAYEPDDPVSLDRALLAGLPARERMTVVYADSCVFDERELDAMGIVFKRIPRNIVHV